MLLCLAIIVILGIVCGFLYVKKSRDQRAEKQRKAEATRAEEESNDRAFMAFMKAESAGHDFATGKVREISDDVLFGPFRGDDKIYNVIYVWSFKKKNQTHHDQKAMFDDNEHLNIQQFAKSKMREGVSITHGLTGNDEPIMIARKFYQPPADDKSNLGGEIMVIVKAVK